MKKTSVMRGDPLLGAVLRELRTDRRLTLAVTARRVSCAESLLSQVETGARVLQPWLAAALDSVYGTAGALAALSTAAAYAGIRTHDATAPAADTLLVPVPRRGITVPVSRRELLAALGLGALGGTLTTLERAAAAVPADEALLAEVAASLRGLQAAGRLMPPHRLIRPLTAQVALLEVARRRAPQALRTEFIQLQARHAESLSWMAEEAGDLTGALYWTDRAQQWAAYLGWSALTAYSYVRRSMLAISFSSDGHAAVEQATHALHIPGAPPRIRGMAAKQLAYGHALAGRPDACKYTLDQTLALFDAADRHGEDGPLVGQRSVATPDLLAIYYGTCEVYLGGGQAAITALAPRLDDIGGGSKRTQAITSAKLAQAYTHAGAPDQACRLILATLDASAAVDSLTTRSELRRALPLLARWPGRDDVAEVRHRLATLA